jgi:uncharacterized membrane protein
MSTHQIVNQQSIVRKRSSANRSKAKAVLWFLMALAGVSVIFSTELPILLDKTGPNHAAYLGLIRDRYLFIPHAIGGILAIFIGPIQFSSRLRSKHLQLHRYLGRTYAYSVFIAAILAVVISWHRPLIVGTTVQSTAWFLSTLFAVLTARNRYVAQHRQWMIRSYAVTFTFVTLRILNFWPAYANMSDPTFNLLDIIVTFLSVSIPTIAFNWRELTTKRG